MQAFKRVTSLAMRMPITYRPVALFSGDKWKDRDEAAEKVYISQTESKRGYTQSRPSRNY